VRDHLAATRKGEWLFVEMHCRGSFPRAQCILRLRSIALPAGPAVADVVARFCGRCHEWHTSDVDGVPLPATDTSYFEVRRATPEEIATATTTTSAECDDSDAGSDDNDDTTNNDDNAALDEIVRNADRDPLLAAAPATSAVLRLKDALGGLHIIQGRPQHVHRAAWRAVAPETRAAHERMLRRLRDSPPEIQVMPLSRAVVEVILRMARERRWRDSTTSSQLAMARAALRNLMFHSLALRGHDVGDDRYFAEVQRSLQRLARISALRPLRSRPLTFLEFERLKRVAPHELTTLSWYLAGRVGDVRRLQPHNVDIAIDNVDQHGNVYVKATFTKGKGAHFWGPYSIHTRIPLADAKRIFEHVATARSNPQQGDLFSLVEQRDLSKAIGSLHDASLRSIRRGALTHFADCGASDRQIQQLSGHQSIATLQRYLDWGARSAEAKEAAQARADLAAQATTIHGGGGHPMWMGPHSGFATAHGKRVPSAPLLFPLKPATREALGLAPDPAEGDPSVWPLKAKRVRPIDPQTVLDVTEDEQLKAAFRHMMKFTSGGELLGVTWPPLVGPQLPKTSFSADDWKKLVTIGKAVPLRVVGSKATTVPLDGSVSRTFDIKSACKGFATPQHSKHERRPVFEPLTNATSSRIWVPYGHRSRQELRSTFSCCRFRWQFDFTSWFDQLELQNIEYFVCRGTPAMVDVNGSPESFEYFALTRPPQGGSWCSHLLSTLTWCIAEPLLKMPGIVVATQIDNVAIGGDDPQQFLSALRVFLQRCTHVGAQLNDMDTFPATDGEILRVADARNSLTFLGEVYKDDVVCNTVKNIEKITEAWTRLQRSIGVDSSPVTRRHIASLIGTLVWCAHTLNEPLRSHYTVLKTFSDISRGATSARGWDEAILITPRLVNTLAPLVGIVLRNSPAKASEFKRHAEDAIYNALQYDAIIVVDASATGAGALIFFPHTGEVVECRMGWRTHIAHSAWAEPIAAREAVRLARSWGAKTIAVVTDHAALAHGQRRPLSGNGAFSCAWHLNEFYRELYTVEGDHQVFYVEGCKNPADGPSRMTVVGDTRWHCRPLTDLVHPNLRDFFHPYALPSAKERDKAWWNL
jgi:integrase